MMEELLNIELRLDIEKALSLLSPQEEKVIRLKFGLDGPQMTRKQIGEFFGVTNVRIMQIEQKALRKLRKPEITRSILCFGWILTERIKYEPKTKSYRLSPVW
jgi:DNA-directed RNA polymerase sigma subunit (sigma70/sigma32)